MPIKKDTNNEVVIENAINAKTINAEALTKTVVLTKHDMAPPKAPELQPVEKTQPIARPVNAARNAATILRISKSEIVEANDLDKMRPLGMLYSPPSPNMIPFDSKDSP